MKTSFNIEIDLGELFCDGENTIAEDVKKEIVAGITAQVKFRVKEQISDMLDISIRETIDKKIGSMAREIMCKKFDENAEIVTNQYSNQKRPIKELCSLYFAEALQRNNIESKMKDYCKGIAEELKKRYDLQFAALIVDNLKKQNLLADDRLAEIIKQN